jgi:hypothetical protein
MVVVARPMVDLAAGVTALYLDGGVPDVEVGAQSLLQVADNVLGIGEG